MTPPRLIFLVCPTESTDVMTFAIHSELIRRACRGLMERGFPVVSTALTARPTLDAAQSAPHAIRLAVDSELIARCDAVFVLAVPHWERSAEYAERLSRAQELAKPIAIVEPMTLTITPALDLTNPPPPVETLGATA